MRIWDVAPGYLNRQSLLGEHAELHAIYKVLEGGGPGYAHQPETVRWHGRLDALALCYARLVAEMEFRGFTHRSPLPVATLTPGWPEAFVDPPARQYELLVKNTVPGRQAGPPADKPEDALASAQVLHPGVRAKASPRAGLELGEGAIGMEPLARELTELLCAPPDPGALGNALDHLWGLVKGLALSEEKELAAGQKGVESAASDEPSISLRVIRTIALRAEIDYLLESTALRELPLWLEE